MHGIGTTAGARLITEQTGRPCSAQNLGKHVRRGRLPRSTISDHPIRLDERTLVAEYLAVVDPRQALVANPGPAKERPAPPPHRSSEDLPDYNVSRARTEFEKANLLELDRKTKEGLLLPREQVERVWANAITIARTKLLGVPTRVRQRVPHLTLEEVATMEELIREALEELADGGSDGD